MKRYVWMLGSIVVIVAAVCVVQAQAPAKEKLGGPEDIVEIYKSLGRSLVQLKNSEKDAMRMIIRRYHDEALIHLNEAAKAGAADPKQHLEKAATLVGYVANEGDPELTAFTQELQKQGHHHHHHTMSEPGQPDQYILIDTKERAAFLELSKKIAQLGAAEKVDGQAVSAAASDLSSKLAAALKE